MSENGTDSQIPYSIGDAEPNAQKERRRDTVRMEIENEAGTYGVVAYLEDGQATTIELTDCCGGTIELPSAVLGQLMGAVGTQESLIRGAIVRAQAGAYGMGGLLGAQVNQTTRPSW